MGAIMALLTPPFKVPQAQALADRKSDHKPEQVSGQRVKHQEKKSQTLDFFPTVQGTKI